MLPKPKSRSDAAMAKLSHVRGEVATTLDFIRKIQEEVGSFLKRHYETIPPAKVGPSHRSQSIMIMIIDVH
jgi:hypothetical protein